jgi:hypothetical protein
MNTHAHTRDCLLICLKPLLSAQTYGLLRSECALICGDQDASVGHAVSLYQKGQLATVRYIGPVRLEEIRACLAGLGLLTGPAGHPEPPPVLAGWSGTWTPPGNRTRGGLFVS